MEFKIKSEKKKLVKIKEKPEDMLQIEEDKENKLVYYYKLNKIEDNVYDEPPFQYYSPDVYNKLLAIQEDIDLSEDQINKEFNLEFTDEWMYDDGSSSEMEDEKKFMKKFNKIRKQNNKFINKKLIEKYLIKNGDKFDAIINFEYDDKDIFMDNLVYSDEEVLQYIKTTELYVNKSKVSNMMHNFNLFLIKKKKEKKDFVESVKKYRDYVRFNKKQTI